MERCCAIVDGNKWMLACDQPENAKVSILSLLWAGNSQCNYLYFLYFPRNKGVCHLAVCHTTLFLGRHEAVQR